MSTLVKSKKHGLWVRPETCDEMVCGEIDRSYKSLNLTKEDVVLDIGGNIGAFAVWAAKQCRYVHSYEPDAENCHVLAENIKGINNASFTQAAIVGTNAQSVEFFTNDSGRNKGLHSLVVKRGRSSHSVPAVNFNAELAMRLPSVLKIDVEGGEYGFLLDNPLPSYVRKIVLEIHLQTKLWRYDQAPRLIAQLEAQFPNILVKAHVDEKNRATLGSYSR